MKQDTKKELSWVPRRRGAIYCAPACGGDCTYDSYVTARESAAKLAKQLGREWKPEVQENLGWHWNVRWGIPGYGIVLYAYKAKRFLAGVESGGYAHAMSHTADGTSAEAALKALLEKVQSIALAAEELAAMVAAVYVNQR